MYPLTNFVHGTTDRGIGGWIDGHIMIYHGYIRLYHILHSVFAKCICIHIYMYLEGCC